MKEDWFVLYDEMLEQLESLNTRNGDYRNKIENCFNLAQQYMTRIQSLMEEYEFTSPKEETEFYKLIKPLFKSQAEYYNLLYQAEILKPAEADGEMKEFWIREQQKLDRFIKHNEDFYKYYKSGASNRDEYYFLLPGHVDEYGKTIYYDDLIAMILALERYKKYCDDRIQGRES